MAYIYFSNVSVRKSYTEINLTCKLGTVCVNDDNDCMIKNRIKIFETEAG